MTQNKRLGSFITKKATGESFKAFIPPDLPPEPAVNLKELYHNIDRATQALGELNSITCTIPNKALFIYMYVRKEALLSSQIEGTQSSFSDFIFFENNQKTNIQIDDVEEVSNYVRANNYGLKRLKSGFPLCLRLLKEMHGVLLQGGRGSTKNPGEFRKSQNWIGGTRPGNALFVPPSPEKLPDLLKNLEKFLHDEKLPTLVKAGIAHVQFETIHPFLDGNGRLGRLLIILLLCEQGLLKHPILYISLHLKQNRQLCYNLLQEVRTHGTWETWLEFFLDGVVYTAKQAIETTKKMNKLFDDDLAKINTLGKAKFSCINTIEYLKKLPQVSVKLLAEKLNISAPTARNSLNNLVKLRIVKEITKKNRDKIYVYKKYLDILEYGAEPL